MDINNMYNWITLLYTWNLHNIVNQLYANKINLEKKVDRVYATREKESCPKPKEKCAEYRSGKEWSMQIEHLGFMESICITSKKDLHLVAWKDVLDMPGGKKHVAVKYS